jgi:hypothetical protein
MRRQTSQHRTYMPVKLHSSGLTPLSRTATVTEEAALWKAYRLSAQNSTTKTFRPQRNRPASRGLLNRLKNHVLVALGIW